MFQPSQKILQRYASVLVNFALASGAGMKKGEVVLISVQTPGLPLAKEVCRAVVRAGGHPLVNISDDDFRKILLTEGNRAQAAFFPAAYYHGLSRTIDHSIRILADRDPLFLSAADPRKILLNTGSTRPYRDKLDKKEDAGRFTWTLCLYGTEGTAREAGMSLRAYWRQIERACFLDRMDPIGSWRAAYREMQRIIGVLSRMPISTLHVRAEGTDLTVGIGEQRRWLGGRGRNIPSFEIFTSPDWRLVEGHVRFDLPLYRYGQIIRDVRLELRAGRIVKARAAKNGKLLREMIAQSNADKIGEFSLTDRRFSRITRFMAETLFDENFGGRYGNVHLALGRAYHDACSVDPKTMTRRDFRNLGFNDSPEHTDIVATTDRTVTAVLDNGSKKVIYKGGEFTV
ncbi:MAG: aminopeptidase [Chitinispirillaceae bacterium]|nr:aminopeptidase [Chitinispirillaceae bacterium]